MLSFSGSYQPRDQTQVSCNACRFSTIWGTREASFEQQADDIQCGKPLHKAILCDYFIFLIWEWLIKMHYFVTSLAVAAATAKSLQSCPILCDPIDGSPPGSPVPGILQAITLEWVAIFFSNAWKWKVKVKLLSCVGPSATPWTAAFQAPPSMGFSRQEYWSGVPLPSPAVVGEIMFLMFSYYFILIYLYISTTFKTLNQQLGTVQRMSRGFFLI